MLRLVPLSLLAACLFTGCPYGDGSPCEDARDCASGRCCGATTLVRGICRPATEACTTAFDAGDQDVPPVDAPIDVPDAPITEDGGAMDAGQDSGVDAPEPMDAGEDASEDTGAGDAPESDVPVDG